MKTILLLSLLLLSFIGHAFQKVDLNVASHEDIALLPGVGEKLALEIILERQRKGVLSLADVKKLPGASLKKVQHMKPHLFFGPGTSKEKAVLQIAVKALPLPELSMLEQAMFKALGLEPEDELLLKKRARTSAMLPKLSLSFDLDRDQNTSKRRRTNKEETLQRGSVDFGFSIQATFDLPELIFNKAELDVESLILKRLDKREKVLERLHELYFSYAKLNDMNFVDDETHLEILSKKRPLQASIDSMTGGAFSSWLDAHKELKP